jgi:hypothetical protein
MSEWVTKSARGAFHGNAFVTFVIADGVNLRTTMTKDGTASRRAGDYPASGVGLEP